MKLVYSVPIGFSSAAAIFLGINYGLWLAFQVEKTGIKRDSKSVEIGDFVSPFKVVKYEKRKKGDGANMIISQPLSSSEFLYDFGNNDIVDMVSNSDLELKRETPGTEGLFQRADEAWKEYKTRLNVEGILAQGDAQEYPDYSKEFHF